MSVIEKGLRALIAIATLLTALAFMPAAAQAQDVVSGPATTVDADIIWVNKKQRVILWGVDAVERTQLCYIGDLKWDCYAAARQALDAILATGDVTCTLTADAPDKFNRRYGVCKIGDLDVGAELIKEGQARAYVDQDPVYLPVEQEAIAAQIGIFQQGAKIDNPWDWRKKDPRNYR